VAAAIRGVLRALDPHSHYESRIAWQRQNALERGELYTIGIALEEVEGSATVQAVAPKSPAAKAGVLAGDRILTMNDTSVAGLDMSTLALRLAGDKGSKVRLRMERGPRLEPDTFSVTLKRNPFDVRSVSIVRMVDSSTGYLRLEEFTPTASEEVHNGLKKLRGHARAARDSRSAREPRRHRRFGGRDRERVPPQKRRRLSHPRAQARHRHDVRDEARRRIPRGPARGLDR
jgi:C-terminal processing protease CtpA/Prc